MLTQTARYYDLIYAAKGKNYEREARLLDGFIQRHKCSAGRSLLDVACGTGGHLVFFSHHYEVEGLDIDDEMLAVAREKLPDVRFHHSSMLDFSLAGSFDAVLCLFSSIAYLRTIDALRQAVANMARHTLPGGVLIIEPWIHPEAFRPGATSPVLVDKPDLKIARMGVATTDGRLSIFDLHYLVSSSDGVRHFQERHELALWPHVEYVSALEAAGLQVLHDPVGLDKRGLYIGLKPP